MSDYNQLCLKTAKELDSLFDDHQRLLMELSKDFNKAMETDSEEFVKVYWRNYINTANKEYRKLTGEVEARINTLAEEHLDDERVHRNLENIKLTWNTKIGALAVKKNTQDFNALNDRHKGLLTRGYKRADGTWSDVRTPVFEEAVESEKIKRAAQAENGQECPKCADCCKNAKEEPIGKIFAEKAKNMFEYLLEQGAAIGYDNDLYVLLSNAIQGAIQLKWSKILETGISA